MNPPEPKSEHGELRSELSGPTSDLRTLSSEPPIYDCWNTIGVEGNGSCQELRKYIHCRNCPVYGAAGRQLLERPLDPAYRREQSAHYAVRQQLRSPAKLSVIIFRLGPEWFALPTPVLQEVAERRPLHTLPHRRDGIVLGLVNVRGELVVCASLARKLGLPEQSAFRTAHSEFRTSFVPLLLVTNWRAQRLALPVDEVRRIHRFAPDDLREAPATVTRSTVTYTRGVLPWSGPAPRLDGTLGSDETQLVGLLEADLLFTALNQSLI